MILKAERIAELLKEGEDGAADPLVISPCPNLKALRKSGAASVDLRLGSWFVTLRQARMTHFQVDDQPSALRLSKTNFVPFGEEYILHPRNFVLAATLEWIRLKRDQAAYLVGRSSWGRRGLVIATATGVHPGFVGCLTLELANVGEIPIAIRPGMPVCQLFIHKVETSDTPYSDQSQFLGLRRPSLESIVQDKTAKLLAMPDL